MKIVLTAFALCLVMSFSAQAETLYHVEIIAFARDSAEADSEENWNRHPALRYPEKIVALQSEGNNPSAFQQLSSESQLLNNEVGALKNRRNIRVLAHLAWQQPVEDAAHTTSVLVTGGKTFGNHHELEGSIALSADHFLRADVNLWLNHFTSNSIDGVALPNIPGGITDNAASNNVAAQTMVLQELRRLRSGELHYFDHPQMGLLMLVKPVASIQNP